MELLASKVVIDRWRAFELADSGFRWSVDEELHPELVDREGLPADYEPLLRLRAAAEKLMTALRADVGIKE
jgi:hypothetical protein